MYFRYLAEKSGEARRKGRESLATASQKWEKKAANQNVAVQSGRFGKVNNLPFLRYIYVHIGTPACCILPLLFRPLSYLWKLTHPSVISTPLKNVCGFLDQMSLIMLIKIEYLLSPHTQF